MTRILLNFPAQHGQAEALAPAVDAMRSEVIWHRFPDGESLVRIDTPVAGADVGIVASLDRPDIIALPLRFAAATARELGARSVGLVAPYLAYLRQDHRFHAGETLSASHFATYLSDSFDWLVTVDAHLHRVSSLAEWYSIPTANVRAAPAVAEWLKINVDRPYLIGPDGESAQWVEAIARSLAAPWCVLVKQRLGDAAVAIRLPVLAGLEGCTPVFIDDIISTGRTLETAMRQLASVTTTAPVCVATHAVFAGDAFDRLSAAGAARLVTSDTIPHRTNDIAVAALLAPAIDRMLRDIENGGEDTVPASQEAWFGPDEPAR